MARLADSRQLGRWLLLGSATISLMFILLPLVFVTWLSFFRQEIPSFPPEGYSLHWYAAIWDESKFVDGLVLSLKVAVVATTVALAISVPAALAISRYKFRGRDALNNLVLMPLVVPGVVLGAALYVFQVEAELVTDIRVLGTVSALVASHVLIAVPWCVRLVSSSLVGLNREIEEAAKNLGATPWTAFWRITLPSIRPGLVAGALFGFVVSFGNLEMTIFLVGPGRTTLPIAILQYLEWKIDPTIAAVSVVQVFLIATALLVTDRFVRLSRVV